MGGHRARSSEAPGYQSLRVTVIRGARPGRGTQPIRLRHGGAAVSRRPGFYFRVLEEGEVEAGDEIVKVASGQEQMTVAEVDGLLYLPGHQRQQLLRALRIPALSPGWQASFRALLDGGPGVATPAWRSRARRRPGPGSARTVAGIDREGDTMISIRLEDPDGASLPPARPGQYVHAARPTRRR